MKNNDLPRYRILYPLNKRDLFFKMGNSFFTIHYTHILAPVFNGVLECGLPWYYFNNETLVKTL